jgi:hypothetical protein
MDVGHAAPRRLLHVLDALLAVAVGVCAAGMLFLLAALVDGLIEGA